jgi:hypothetical protein
MEGLPPSLFPFWYAFPYWRCPPLLNHFSPILYLMCLAYVLCLTYSFHVLHSTYNTAPLIDAFHCFQALGPWNGGHVTPWSYLCVTCPSFHVSILSLLPCVLPARFSASTELTSDLAIISILSSYVPIMHYVTHFPLLYRHSHVYVSFLLMTLSDSPLLYTSRIAHRSTYWCVLFLYLHVYLYFTYVFIPRALMCLLTLLWCVHLPYLYK